MLQKSSTDAAADAELFHGAGDRAARARRPDGGGLGHDGDMKQQQQPGGAQPELVHAPAQSRYEIHVDGRLAGHAAYRAHGDEIHFTHTEIAPAHEGQGLGSRLAGFALDDVKTRGLKAVPKCPFIAKYIARHEEEYGDLVAR